MTKTIKNTAKKLISLAAAACKALKAICLAVTGKTKQRLQKLPARIFRSLKTAWRKFIKLQDRILFDGKTALRFIFWTGFLSVFIKVISNTLKTEIFLYKNILGIYGILGALLGALFIFTAAEGLRDRNEKYKARILLNSSKLNTLILLFLLSLIPLIFPQLHVFSLSALISFIIFSGYSVYQILSMLLNIEVLLNKEINLFRKGIKKATDFVTDCRSKNKELLKRMKENQIKLQYICVFPPFFINFEMLKIEKEGIVTDIDLDKLKSIAGKIDKAITAASRKKALSDAQIIPESSANSQINMPEPQRDPKPKEKNFSEQISESKYFSILVGNSIKEETPILSFDKNIQIDKSKIQKQLKQAITVEKSTVVLEVKAELEEFKIMMEKFIKAKNFNQFKRRFDSYFEMAKIFLTCLSEKNQLYSYQEAKTDSGMALGEASSWPPLSWLTDHVMSFFEKAREIKKTGDSESKNIYEEIKWLSYRLMIFSKEKNDHLLFQKSLALWQRQFYILSKGKVDEKEIKDHVNFFRNYIITPVFFETIEEGIKEERKNYAVFLLEIIKGVFESALSQNLSCLFPHIAKIIRHISEKPFSTEPSYYRSFANIKYLAISPLAFKSPESYESKRLQFLFGLGAYLESQSNSELNHIKEVIRDSIPRLRFADLENYLKIYPLMMSAETEKFWHWDFFNAPSEKGSFISPKDENVKSYFLSLMSDIPKALFDNLNIRNLDPKEISALENLARFNPDLLQNINISDEGKKNIKNLFGKIFEHQNRQRLKYVVKITLDNNKIQEFITGFRKDFIKEQSMREFFKCSPGQKNYKSLVFGRNDIFEKVCFISANNESANILNISSSSIRPLDFANSFFIAENKFLQDEILKRCAQKQLFYAQFKELILKRQWKNSEMLLLPPDPFSKIILELPNLNDLNIPSKSVFIHQKGIQAVIFDKSKLPELKMFNPADPETELFPFQYLQDIGISIGIGAFSHNPELMKLLTGNPPDWLKKIGGAKAQKEYLNTRINIKILQGIYLSWRDSKEPIGEAFSIIDA